MDEDSFRAEIRLLRKARGLAEGALYRVVGPAHSGGARIFAQLMHAGSQSQGNRFRDSSVGPSAVAPKGEPLAFYRGEGPYPVPSEITADQMDEVRQGFVTAALHAEQAGFDGVEIHGANGYLLDQFLTDYLNRRTDGYGGKSLAILAKQHAGVPVIANGNLDEPETAASLLESGAADVVALVKAALATRN